MKTNRTLPFQNITPAGWQNLALVAIFAFYIVEVGFDLFSRNLCGNLAVDYCAYWSAGKIINERGYGGIYDLNLMEQFQKAIHPNTPAFPFSVIPVPYLPVFLIPFQLLSFLSLESSFWVWTLLNLFGFVLYLRFFMKEVSGHALPGKLVFMALLSLPVFLNLFYGQVNIWLGICAGEFMRASLSKKPFRAGLWLGGWLLKPQLLVLIIPVLLIQRSIKSLAGFAVSTLAVLGVSFYLVKLDGFLSLSKLLFGYSKGMATNNPEVMMNWRMLGLHLSSLISPFLGWGVIILGSILTVAAILIICRKPLPPDSVRFAIALFGVFAATCALSWHAHFSMSIILIPPMLYLYIQKRLPWKLLLFWVFMPIVILIFVYILGALMHAKILPAGIAELLDLLNGLRGLVLNLVFLGWAVIEHARNDLQGAA